jgi:hypothetical protein
MFCARIVAAIGCPGTAFSQNILRLPTFVAVFANAMTGGKRKPAFFWHNRASFAAIRTGN